MTKSTEKATGRITLDALEKEILSPAERADFREGYARYRSALMRARHAIAEALTERMLADGTRYEDVTAALGVSRTTLARLLNGTGNPTLDTLFYVASNLGLRLEFSFSNEAEADSFLPKSQATKLPPPRAA
jgi:DNA-binding phage protein